MRARLKRCTANTYPPTAESCSALTYTGVTYQRVIDVVLGTHQVRVHDSFTSTDGQPHTVRAQYQSRVERNGSGSPGYAFPGHGTSFSPANPDQVVTGFGSSPAATVLVRSDVYAAVGEPMTDCQALTWSRPPSEIQFSHTADDTLAMPYTFHVRAGGTAQLGLAESEEQSPAKARTLATTAETAI
jgi:hypothetical protein